MKKAGKYIAAALAAVLVLAVLLPAKASAATPMAIDSVVFETFEPVFVGEFPLDSLFIGSPAGAHYAVQDTFFYAFDDTIPDKYDPEGPLPGEMDAEAGKFYVMEVIFRRDGGGYIFTKDTKTPLPEYCEEVLGSKIVDNDYSDMSVLYKCRAYEAYDMQISPDAADFGTAAPGYKVPEAKKITVTNTGGIPLSFGKLDKLKAFDVSIPVEVDDDKFIDLMEEDGALTLSTGDSLTILVTPKPDLPEGEYKETLTVRGGDILGPMSLEIETEETNDGVILTAELPISFKVATPAPATGDSGSMQLWTLLGLVTLGGAVILMSRKNRVRG